jgi:hypothetical protein
MYGALHIVANKARRFKRRRTTISQATLVPKQPRDLP